MVPSGQEQDDRNGESGVSEVSTETRADRGPTSNRLSAALHLPNPRDIERPVPPAKQTLDASRIVEVVLDVEYLDGSGGLRWS